MGNREGGNPMQHDSWSIHYNRDKYPCWITRRRRRWAKYIFERVACVVILLSAAYGLITITLEIFR
jgi:hypothetical protein